MLRTIRPVLAALLTLGSLAWSADMYRDVGLVLFPEQFLSGMLGTALALVFLHYPARRAQRTDARAAVRSGRGGPRASAPAPMSL